MSEELKKNSEMDDLRGLVSELTGQVKKLSEKKNPGSGVVRKRVKEHTAFMREYSVKDSPVGLVTKLYDVKEVQDKTENKRYIGLCKIDVLNPKTGETKSFKDINYLEFLDQCPKVLTSIVRWDKTVRYETDPRKGGGGTGAVLKQGVNNEYVVDFEHDFEVGYIDHTYTLKVLEGAFEGDTFIHENGTGLNI
jgi:hypothetical protein